MPSRSFVKPVTCSSVHAQIEAAGRGVFGATAPPGCRAHAAFCFVLHFSFHRADRVHVLDHFNAIKTDFTAENTFIANCVSLSCLLKASFSSYHFKACVRACVCLRGVGGILECNALKLIPPINSGPLFQKHTKGSRGPPCF